MNILILDSNIFMYGYDVIINTVFVFCENATIHIITTIVRNMFHVKTSRFMIAAAYIGMGGFPKICCVLSQYFDTLCTFYVL